MSNIISFIRPASLPDQEFRATVSTNKEDCLDKLDKLKEELEAVINRSECLLVGRTDDGAPYDMNSGEPIDENNVRPLLFEVALMRE